MTAPVETVNGVPVLWKAHNGPQTKFLSSVVPEVLYGGAAGGGKTDALVYGALRQVGNPKYTALILRRTFPELRELMDRAQLYYGIVGGTWNAQDRRWSFPSGATIEFGYCQTYAEAMQYKTDEFTYIAYDQLEDLPEERIWTYLMTRNRAKGPGLRLMMRASANPGGAGGLWIRSRFVDICPKDGSAIDVETTTPDGKVIKSRRAFIRAKLEDNPTLQANDPGYGDRLGLAGDVSYMQLRYGDFEVGGGTFYPEIFTQADQDRLFITPSQLPPLLDWYDYWASVDWGFQHPMAFSQYVRIKDTIYVLDTTYLHRYQDEEQASTIRGTADKRCLRTVFAGHDAFAKRLAHSAAAETVADVYGRYSIHLERANIDRSAGAKVMRRFFAQPQPGPMLKGTITVRWVDTPGNRRAISEFASLIPEETHTDVPEKRDANDKGLNGDDGADCNRYGLVTPTFEPQQPPPVWRHGNVDTGVDTEFEELTQQPFRLTAEGVVDKREYAFRSAEPNADFPYDNTDEF